MTTPGELDPITGDPRPDPTLLDEREPLRDGPLPDEAFMEPVLLAPVAPPPAPSGQPEAVRGVSTGNLTCAVCRRPIPEGESYVQGAARGATHEEPCSHQA